MKDHIMPRSNQELEDSIEKNFDQLIRLLREAEDRTCAAATKDQQTYGPVNAKITKALGLAVMAKGEATEAGLAMPDITVNFGGK